jgi:hypothetical protein
MATSRKPDQTNTERHVPLENGGKITLPQDLTDRLRGNRSFILVRHPDGLVELWPHSLHSTGTETTQISLGKDNTVTLPEGLCIGLDEGTLFTISQRPDLVIELRLDEPSDPSQQWYWTDRWQQMEREADEDYAAGRHKRFDNVEDFLAYLDADHET